MFLHIGGDVVIPMKNVIGILDIDTSRYRRIQGSSLKLQEEGFVTAITQDIPRSFIITEEDKKSRIYLSPISSVTLQKRSVFMNDMFR